MPKFLFFLSVFMVLYVFVGYPALVSLLAAFKNRKVKKGDFEPHVTIITAAYNEERHIGTTLSNKLALDYPTHKRDIIVVSDGSTDATDDVVKQFEHQNVRLLRQEPRAGKTAALNMAVLEAKGEILVFSDANSMYNLDALRMLVQNFCDPSVGYVTGRMVYTNPDGTTIGDGCSTYMKYENFLRGQETRLGSVVGVDGGIDAVRKDLYRPMDEDQLPDFVLPLKVVEQGYRVVYDPSALLKEASLATYREEYRMRVRVTLRALWAINDMAHLLSLRRFGLFAWQLWSHKVLRYVCFIFLVGAYLANLTLWDDNTFYKAGFVIQNVAYLAAIVSPIFEKGGVSFQLPRLLKYFVLLNLAATHAFIKFLFGRKQVVWIPRSG